MRTVLLFSGDDRIVTTTVDTSVLGLSLRSGVPRQAGEFLRLAWPLASGEWAGADAVVARTARSDLEQCLVVGMRFLRVDPRLQRELALHVTRVNVRPLDASRGRTPPTPSRSQTQLRLDPELEAMLPRSRGELEELFRRAVEEVDAISTGTASRRRA